MSRRTNGLGIVAGGVFHGSLRKAKRFQRKTTAKGIYFTNLGLILLCGVLLCAWLLYFSDWFEVVGGLLTLGGAFTWLAFVSKILREDRIKELQDWVEKNILEQKKTLILSSSLLLLEVLAACLLLGTIQVESLQESSDRALYVYSSGSKRGEAIRLPPGGARRVVLLTTWWSPSEYVVKVSGYPDIVEKLQPLHRTELRVPSSFRRPIVLVRPTAFLADMVGHDEQRLAVSVTRRTGETIGVGENLRYTGRAIWIGCDDDVQVPQAIQDGWLYQLGADQRLSSYWRRPEILGDKRLELNPGDSVHAELRDKNGTSKATSSKEVQLPQGREEFVIEEVLDVSASHQ
jgi:hypothetical protein